MNELQNKFLVAILGPDGAGALKMASERSEVLGQAILPRSVLSWVNGVGEFAGIIPGTDNLLSRFAKSEKGFSGYIDSHEFEDASLIHVCSAIAVALGAKDDCGDEAKSLDLERLGKSLDLLVRSKLVQDNLAKSEESLHKGEEVDCPGCGSKVKKFKNGNLSDHYENKSSYIPRSAHHDNKVPMPSKGVWCSKKPKEDLAKAGMEPQVKNAAPVAPTAPVAAGQTPAVKPAGTPAVAKAPKLPKLPKPAGATVALARSEMNYLCPACASAQFTGDELTPCICFQDLKKSIDILALDELGCVLHISESMPDIVTFLEAMGRN